VAEMDETKTCKNCEYWEDYDGGIDLSDDDKEELQGKKVCDRLSSIITYEIGKYGAVSNGWKTYAIMATEPDFG
jgi:neutral trehalase